MLSLVAQEKLLREKELICGAERYFFGYKDLWNIVLSYACFTLFDKFDYALPFDVLKSSIESDDITLPTNINTQEELLAKDPILSLVCLKTDNRIIILENIDNLWILYDYSRNSFDSVFPWQCTHYITENLAKFNKWTKNLSILKIVDAVILDDGNLNAPYAKTSKAHEKIFIVYTVQEEELFLVYKPSLEDAANDASKKMSEDFLLRDSTERKKKFHRYNIC